MIWISWVFMNIIRGEGGEEGVYRGILIMIMKI